MKEICALFGASKQAYYKHDDEALMHRLMQEQIVAEFVREVRQLDPCIGGKKLFLMYQREFSSEHKLGRDAFERIINRMGMNVRQKRRDVPKTTDSTHGLPTYPNKVYSLIPLHPNQVWVSDITYIKIWDDIARGLYHFAYLSLITDAYTHQIMGWCVGDSLETCYPLRALQMALDAVPKEQRTDLIHHSDRGVQYASYQYVRLLKKENITISMTENGNPKHNAIAERINNTIKNEFFAHQHFTSIEQVRQRLEQVVEFYNCRRPHCSINMLTPQEAAQCTGEIKKHWKSYREAAIYQAKIEAIANGTSSWHAPLLLTGTYE